MSNTSAKEIQLVAETLVNNSDKEDNGRSSKKAVDLSLRVQLLSWIYRMMNLCKDLAIMLLVAFTYAALVNEPPKVIKSPPAYPFFAHNSTVRDYFRGQISLATEYAKTADIAFVMFYAPWDAASQTIRGPFEEAARLMQNQVVFAAVNCWQPGGECRNQYSKVYKWPVLIAYAVHSRGVQYSGPYETHHFIKFLNAVAKPFVRVTYTDELDNFIANYDATVVAYVNATPGQYNYAVLYTAALKLLEKDPFQEIAFVVCTVAKSERPIIEFHMWNESWVYPEESEWLSDQIVNWIFKKLHQVTLWYHPSGMKSRHLSTFLQSGPSLILFTPKNPLITHSDLYSMLREIGLEYNNCDKKWRITDTHSLLRKSRIENYKQFKEDLKKCNILTTRKRYPVVISYAVKEWSNVSENFCSNMYDVCHKTSNCKCIYDECKKKPIDTDPLSASNLVNFWQKEKCKLLKISQNYHSSIYSQNIIDYVDNKKIINTFNISGLGCKTNTSLTLIAIDSLMYFYFAERLGINILKKKDKTAAVIINEKQEMHHILEGRITDTTLRQFIYNFSTHNLNRALNSPKLRKNISCAEQTCISELNTQNFLTTVMQPHKVVVVFYHSKQCFFCSGISHVLLTVAHLLRDINFLKFVRIDGDLNDLPWEYTMEKYPTILLFPLNKKSESRVFPRNMAITVENIINFILANMEHNLWIPIMYTLCEQTKFLGEKEQCTRDIRLKILSLIELNLKKWRKVDGLARATVLYRLKLLKRLHLILGCSLNDEKEIYYLLKRIEYS